MEDEADWHSRKMTKEEGASALREIAGRYRELGFGDVRESILFLDRSELAALIGEGGDKDD